MGLIRIYMDTVALENPELVVGNIPSQMPWAALAN